MFLLLLLLLRINLLLHLNLLLLLRLNYINLYLRNRRVTHYIHPKKNIFTLLKVVRLDLDYSIKFYRYSLLLSIFQIVNADILNNQLTTSSRINLHFKPLVISFNCKRIPCGNYLFKVLKVSSTYQIMLIFYRVIRKIQNLQISKVSID